MIYSIEVNSAAIYSGRKNSCLLLKRIVYIATPASKLAEATAFIRRTPLNNCEIYAHNPNHSIPLPPRRRN